MTTQSPIRIEIREIEDRPGPFHWELFRGAETEPFLVSRSTFRTARTAYADAKAVIERHQKQKKTD